MDEEYKRFIRESLNDVRERIKKAISVRNSLGRPYLEYPADVNDKSIICGIKLLAASKTVDAETLNFAARELELSCIGENRVQELCDKYPQLSNNITDIHLIGSLQTNKVKYIADKVSLIHSLDRRELAKEISKRGVNLGRKLPVLAEINIGREPDKGGVLPEELWDLIDYASRCEGIQISGLMTMAPAHCTKKEYTEFFSEVRELFFDLRERNVPGVKAEILSMGMSDSFEAAIECGANLVRVGSAIFGKRIYPTQEVTLK